MTTLYANPYDISASGFYFESLEEYQKKAAAACNNYGDPVEEFEIEFIDGYDFDAQLAKAWGLYQSNFHEFLKACEEWEDGEKVKFIIAVGECNYNFDTAINQPDEIDIDIYECASMKELAERFVDEGLFGDVPEHLESYIDYDAIARDLSFDYSETEINGETLIYRCG